MSIFSKVKLKKPKRSTFNLSHNTKLTLPFGQLIPTYWNYFEPNTNFKASSIIQCRTMPMLAPIMHEVNIYSYWWQVPCRLLMNEPDYEAFITGGRTGTDTVNWPKYSINKGNLISTGIKYLLDYMDVPIQQILDNFQTQDKITFDALPFRAYAEIWNNYFRDQNVTPDFVYPKFTGTLDYENEEWHDVDIDMLKTKPRCWTKDYFTSALPWAQRGGNVNVPFTALTELAMDGNLPTVIKSLDNNLQQGVTVSAGAKVAGDDKRRFAVDDNANRLQLNITDHTSAHTSIQGTINDLRTAFAIQRWKERNALGGSRYIEQINSHFNVWADDYRLQRPLFLGGSRSPLQISEILQTSESTNTSVQGNMTGRGYTLDKQGNVHCFVKEHSIIMNMICIVPKASYFQGMPRKLDIRDKFDFPWPLLANLGEQEVRNGELFYTGNPAVDDLPFGYQSRYAQYKFEQNRVHGDFTDSLLFWHLARKFENAPTLNRQFLECREHANGLDRIFPVLDEGDVYSSTTNHFWAQINFNIKVKRPLPYYGTPH